MSFRDVLRERIKKIKNGVGDISSACHSTCISNAGEVSCDTETLHPKDAGSAAGDESFQGSGFLAAWQ